MTTRTGHYAIIEQLLADGITHMFGNPGTVEQGWLDALSAYPQMKYILTLQESVAVMTADGFARANRAPALVQLHSSPGIGNAVGFAFARFPPKGVGHRAGLVNYKQKARGIRAANFSRIRHRKSLLG